MPSAGHHAAPARRDETYGARSRSSSPGQDLHLDALELLDRRLSSQVPETPIVVGEHQPARDLDPQIDAERRGELRPERGRIALQGQRPRRRLPARLGPITEIVGEQLDVQASRIVPGCGPVAAVALEHDHVGSVAGELPGCTAPDDTRADDGKLGLAVNRRPGAGRRSHRARRRPRRGHALILLAPLGGLLRECQGRDRLHRETRCEPVPLVRTASRRRRAGTRDGPGAVAPLAPSHADAGGALEHARLVVAVRDPAAYRAVGHAFAPAQHHFGRLEGVEGRRLEQAPQGALERATAGERPARGRTACCRVPTGEVAEPARGLDPREGALREGDPRAAEPPAVARDQHAGP